MEPTITSYWLHDCLRKIEVSTIIITLQTSNYSNICFHNNNKNYNYYWFVVSVEDEEVIRDFIVRRVRRLSVWWKTGMITTAGNIYYCLFTTIYFILYHYIYGFYNDSFGIYFIIMIIYRYYLFFFFTVLSLLFLEQPFRLLKTETAEIFCFIITTISIDKGAAMTRIGFHENMLNTLINRIGKIVALIIF